KPVAWHRGDNNVESIFSACAIRRRIGEWSNEFQLFGDGARPTVCDDDWQRIRVLRFHVNEMNVEAINRSDKVWQGFQSSLELTPVIFIQPVVGQLLHCRQLYALRRV